MMPRDIKYPDHVMLRAATEERIAELRGKLAELGSAESERVALAGTVESPLLAKALDGEVSRGLAERSKKITNDLDAALRFLETSCVPTHGLTDCEMRCGWAAYPGCYLCDR